jgi:type I restriction enzyme R subunit
MGRPGRLERELGLWLSERDICSKYIAPAIQQAGWDMHKQVREEVSFTKGRIIVRGKLHTRGESRRADFILYHQANLPIAVIEAKDNKHSLGHCMQQALGYAEALDIPFVFSSNGDGFLFLDRSGTGTLVETELTLEQFPSPAELWQRYCQWKGLDGPAQQKIEAPYYDDGSGRMPRYYQTNAINRTVYKKGTDLFSCSLLAVLGRPLGKRDNFSYAVPVVSALVLYTPAIA